MSKPLDHIEITEIKTGENPIIFSIPLSDITEKGIVLGRDKKSCYKQIGSFLKEHPGLYNSIGRKHVTLYRLFNIHRDSYDYYIRRGYRKPNGEWETIDESKGFDIYLGNQSLDRNMPIQLRAGALIDLIENIAGYKIKLNWGVESSGDPSQPPTVPVNEDYINTLQFENRILKEQKSIKDEQIKRLQDMNSKITEFMDKDKQEKDELNRLINKQTQVNKRQDKKLKHMIFLGLVVVGCMAISLGIDAEEIERILEICALLTGSGLIYTAATKDN